jgi:hypothetical protein
MNTTDLGQSDALLKLRDTFAAARSITPGMLQQSGFSEERAHKLVEQGHWLKWPRAFASMTAYQLPLMRPETP